MLSLIRFLDALAMGVTGLLAACLAAAPVNAQRPSSDAVQPSSGYRVNASAINERLSPLNGVNCGPGNVLSLDEGVTPPPVDSLAAQYAEMRITEVRIHDFLRHAGDLTTIFPELSEDPYQSSNYDFSETDLVVDEIHALGCQAMFRFGQSWNNRTDLNYIHPNDQQRLAQVCGQIAKHYGGADSETVSLWEIWNEPNFGIDAKDPTPLFWDFKELDPNFRHFFGLYSRIAKQLKKVEPQIQVGGPGAAGNSDDKVRAFAEQFVKACRRLDAPLDFYSWHSYNRHSEGPYVYARQASQLREILDSYSYLKTKLVLSEWNSANLGAKDLPIEWANSVHDMNGAAFTAAALIYLHQVNVGVDHAYRYRGDFQGNGGYGLIGFPDSNTVQIKKPGYAYKAYSYLFPQDDKISQRLTSSGGNLKNDALLATIDGSRSIVTVLASQWKSSRDEELIIQNLAESWQRCSIDHWMVSKTHNWRNMRHGPAKVVNGSVKIHLDAPLEGESAIHVVRITNKTAIPQTADLLKSKPLPGIAKSSVAGGKRLPGKPLLRKPGAKEKPRKPLNDLPGAGKSDKKKTESGKHSERRPNQKTPGLKKPTRNQKPTPQLGRPFIKNRKSIRGGKKQGNRADK